MTSTSPQLLPLIRTLRQQQIDPSVKFRQLEEQAQRDGKDLLMALADVFAMETISYEELILCSPVFELLNFSEAMRRHCVLVRNQQEQLLLVYANVFDESLTAWVIEQAKQPFIIKLAQEADISGFLASQEEFLRAVDSALTDVVAGQQTVRLVEELSLNSIDRDESQVVRLVRSTLYDALKADASDIHIETMPDGLAIKYRLDGVLNPMGTVKEFGLAEQIISRIKVMAELDITETRVPQDGRFRANYKGREIDFRVSVMPSVHGEDVVIRVLDKKSLTESGQGLSLSSLGFDEQVITTLRHHFRYPYGMILVTGPTGSGKTTSLYAAISEINNGLDKIITIEDPVEYELAGVLQIPVNEKKGLSFARGLRSILRHDPDKIMVGEIRDPETAQIAVQSALTGHLVFTTVHANNVFDVLGRFLNMGVDPYSFVSALNVIIAQRLLRTNCSGCSEPLLLSAEALAEAVATAPTDATPKQGRGCGLCRGTGYKGRLAVAEILSLDDELREMIASRAPISQIKAYAQQQGTRLLRNAALDLVWKGMTTLEEVNRVTAVG